MLHAYNLENSKLKTAAELFDLLFKSFNKRQMLNFWDEYEALKNEDDLEKINKITKELLPDFKNCFIEFADEIFKEEHLIALYKSYKKNPIFFGFEKIITSHYILDSLVMDNMLINSRLSLNKIGKEGLFSLNKIIYTHLINDQSNDLNEIKEKRNQCKNSLSQYEISINLNVLNFCELKIINDILKFINESLAVDKNRSNISAPQEIQDDLLKSMELFSFSKEANDLIFKFGKFYLSVFIHIHYFEKKNRALKPDQLQDYFKTNVYEEFLAATNTLIENLDKWHLKISPYMLIRSQKIDEIFQDRITEMKNNSSITENEEGESPKRFKFK